MDSEEKLILCVGMCVLDIVHICTQFPVEDTDKRCLKGHWQRGGNASNNCTVLKLLGAECEFLGMLSNSRGFQFLIEDCIERKISIKNCPRVNIDPPFSSIILNEENNSRTIIHSNQNFPILKFEHFQNINLMDYKWIHFEGRNVDETNKMIKDIVKFNQENATNIKISVELEKLKPELLKLTDLVDVIFLSKDFSIFLGWKSSCDAVHELRKNISNKNCLIICPWSDIGSSLLTSNNIFYHVNAIKCEKIVDTLGAGDTFCAATIYSLSKNNDARTAVEFGNNVASLKLQFYGYDGINNFKNT